MKYEVYVKINDTTPFHKLCECEYMVIPTDGKYLLCKTGNNVIAYINIENFAWSKLIEDAK